MAMVTKPTPPGEGDFRQQQPAKHKSH